VTISLPDTDPENIHTQIYHFPLLTATG